MNSTEIQELRKELRHFSGTECYYRHFLYPKYVYTEGVKYLAEQAESYWLIDYIFSHQSLASIRGERFQVWKLNVQDHRAKMVVEEGNDKHIATFTIPYTDFPLESFTLWMVDKILLLPSEY